MTERIRIGTRGSPLARAQAEEVIAGLRKVDPRCRPEVVIITTHGDEGYRSDLGTAFEGKRAFTKRIEEALLDGRIDAAVHSLKDVPTEATDGLALAAIPSRADPRDALVAKDGLSLGQLLGHARIGTSSLRRRGQLLARWPNLEVLEIHGNVETRVRHVETGALDGVVVATAGLGRLGLAGPRAEPIDPDIVTPAPGQGALAVQTRTDGDPIERIVSAIDDPNARATTDAERSLSARIGGGCNVPLGAFATLSDGTLHLRAVVTSPDGHRVARASARGAAGDWRRVVERAERQLFESGAERIVAEAR
ncbi:MAG TPA: hydroxymethylbilane synthase [Thermoplasmata archaeon]|nr:hydroxymethylbilane synthase [Thermoplasmata archaeon]